MRVVLAEDLFLLRDGLVRMLEARGFEVVAAVEDGPALLAALLEHRPDVALVDVRLPPTFTDDGLRAVLEARRRIPGLPVVVLSQYVEQIYARELLADGGGAVGYLLKNRVADGGRFAESLRHVARGGNAVDPEVVRKLLVGNTRDALLARLTPREREVLALVAEGRSNAAIAARLSMSEKVVTKHTSNVFGKLELAQSDDDNRRVLAVLAYLGS
ncbi:response regulator [Yinghuangia seranimata]|uniref:response regulator n=1 Tax=Yinghuangia seranimata TaxID=408067 RepID=UPI00248B3436|nr:response regulator transcription factor [Yinghuangia seranimata]MDI2125018.1 response regulator transcription factor [Yinghuangia seranimata]